LLWKSLAEISVDEVYSMGCSVIVLAETLAGIRIHVAVECYVIDLGLLELFRS
jgi:hypothetical protein